MGQCSGFHGRGQAVVEREELHALDCRPLREPGDAYLPGGLRR